MLRWMVALFFGGFIGLFFALTVATRAEIAASEQRTRAEIERTRAEIEASEQAGNPAEVDGAIIYTHHGALVVTQECIFTPRRKGGEEDYFLFTWPNSR